MGGERRKVTMTGKIPYSQLANSPTFRSIWLKLHIVSVMIIIVVTDLLRLIFFFLPLTCDRFLSLIFRMISKWFRSGVGARKAGRSSLSVSWTNQEWPWV